MATNVEIVDYNLQKSIWIKEKKLIILLFIFFQLFYFLTARGYLSTYDYYNRFLLTRAILEKGSLSIENRINTIEGKNGKYYSKYGILESILYIPLFLIGKIVAQFFPEFDIEFFEQFFCSLIFQFFMALSCAVFYFMLRLLHFSSRFSVLLIAIYGLCTLIWPYSKFHNDQPFELLTLLSSFTILLSYKKRFVNLKWIFLSTIIMDFGIFYRPAFVISFPAFAVFLFYSIKKKESKNIRLIIKGFSYFAIMFIPALGGLFFYNYLRFGHLFEFGYEDFQKEFSTSLFIGIPGLFLSPGRGLLWFIPFLFLTPMGLKEFAKKEPEFFISSVILVLSYIMFYGKFSAWYGTEAWGPRYLVPIIPFFIVSIGFALSKWLTMNVLWKILFIFLIFLSFLNQIPPVLVSPGRYFNKIKEIESNEVKEINTIYDLKYSELILHWISLKDVIEIIFCSDPQKQFFSDKIINLENDDPYGSQIHSLVTNVPNFWFVYLYYMNFSEYFIVCLVMLIIFCIIKTGMKILIICR